MREFNIKHIRPEVYIFKCSDLDHKNLKSMIPCALIRFVLLPVLRTDP